MANKAFIALLDEIGENPTKRYIARKTKLVT
jgi:hypothetical protein